MISLFIIPKRRTFGHFLASSEDKLFLVKKEDMSSKRRTYGKPRQHGDPDINKNGRCLCRWTVHNEHIFSAQKNS